MDTRADLLRQAKAKCRWCNGFPAAKDPERGWVHINPDEYRLLGSLAILKCDAPELNDAMLAIEPPRPVVLQTYVLPIDVLRARSFSHMHRELVMRSAVCACYYCKRVFPARDIKEWTDNDQTAVCPLCGIDAVLPQESGLPTLSDAFLEKMHYWMFKVSYDPDREGANHPTDEELQNEDFTDKSYVHNWRNHVPESVREEWALLDSRGRRAVYLTAEEASDGEVWD